MRITESVTGSCWSGDVPEGGLESLGRALLEQPIISGRLQKRDRNDGELEIVSNDSGIRIIEAMIQTTFSEFLDLKQREEAEAQLIFWNDIDEHNPQFSPLFYVQVTNFQCGGYSIGISCSILLVDLFLRTEFLETWASIHINIVDHNNEPKLPLFYLPGFSDTRLLPQFNQRNKNMEIESLACVEDAENGLGSEMGAEFCLFVNESFEVIKVESCSKHGMLKPKLKANMEVIYANWDDLGTNDVSFRLGNKPVHVSLWFRSILGGVVVVIPSPEEEQGAYTVNIFVTVPNEKF
ncbi:taxadien-5-alpha-ol O-acetyltransferase-like [Gossypium australe]|uniref:Taxadien-5-alpha-ol O-acetyltransferase-like n=1 Tax=Gossypium australe TaxID=47621 RepID=A0A5B6W4D5_9ROSI|nr:taxadien-5-alpha-ol O-acetyltransferase-like [Gossypium australe]